jgi:hypothetical protein
MGAKLRHRCGLPRRAPRSGSRNGFDAALLLTLEVVPAPPFGSRSTHQFTQASFIAQPIIPAHRETRTGPHSNGGTRVDKLGSTRGESPPDPRRPPRVSAAPGNSWPPHGLSRPHAELTRPVGN